MEKAEKKELLRLFKMMLEDENLKGHLATAKPDPHGDGYINVEWTITLEKSIKKL